ncbi:hypothetical protein M422DRAFT_252396, partial [Sphaerobolus stellatus SS14]
MLRVDFSTDMQRILFWANRMGIDLRHPKQLSDPYTWALNHILSLCEQSMEFSGLCAVPPSDNRILVTLLPDPYAPRMHAQTDYFNFNPHPNSKGDRIELPVNSTSFFSPNRQGQWEKIFHSRIWESLEQPSFTNPLRDLLHLLQCLLPGMFVLVDINDGWSTE